MLKPHAELHTSFILDVANEWKEMELLAPFENLSPVADLAAGERGRLLSASSNLFKAGFAAW